MKEIFAGFLSVSIASSFVICLILLLRLIFRRAPKALMCCLWMLVFVRLLLPFEMKVPFSLRPETPSFSGMDTQLFIDTEPLWKEQVPDFIPQVVVKSYPLRGTSTVQIDYVAIAGIVWVLITTGLLLYALISYLCLRYRVREAVMVDKNVYLHSGMNSAFLLGYFRPRIYLPNGLEQSSVLMVIAHEHAHMKRGDNWSKLVAFICLSLHWFNPLVWIAYILLCKDIEDACDEKVIKDMYPDMRKAYTQALLSCGSKKHSPAVCPVAFGEISIKKRIINVLNYRKPVLWIGIAAMVAIVLTATFFMTDPAAKNPPYYDQLTSLLGQRLDTVYQELGITEKDVDRKNNLTYGKTSITVEFAGVPMDLYLVDDRVGHLAGFQYVATYRGDREQAAKDAVKLAKERWNSLGYGYGAEQIEDPDRLRYITTEEVLELFENDRREHVGVSNLTCSWDITDQSEKPVHDYLAYLQDSVSVIGDVDENYKTEHQLRFFHNFTVWCDTDEDQEDVATIALIYRTQPIPVQSENSYREVYYDGMTWWEKFVDWLI